MRNRPSFRLGGLRRLTRHAGRFTGPDHVDRARKRWFDADGAVCGVTEFLLNADEDAAQPPSAPASPTQNEAVRPGSPGPELKAAPRLAGQLLRRRPRASSAD